MAFTSDQAPPCESCNFRANCFYGLLEDKHSKEAWRRLRTAAKVRSGESLFYEGEKPAGAFVVCSGKVKVYKSARGGQQLLTRIESPGDLIGHISMLAGWDYSGSAETMEDSVISFIGRRDLETFLLESPKASLALLSEVARDVRRGEAKARDIAYKPARARLAGTLLRTLNPLAKPLPAVGSMKRKELAEMAGLTLETTVRLLKDFETRGLTQREGKEIVVLDLEKLKSLSFNMS